MFHLLKEIVLLPDVISDQSNNVDISLGTMSDYPELDNDIRKTWIHAGRQYDSYDDMIRQEFKTDANFFEWMFNNIHDTIRIYADKEQYACVVDKWLKFMFDNIDEETSYMIYKMSVMNFYIMQVHQQYITHDQPISRKVLVDNFRYLTREQYSQVFQSNLSGREEQFIDLKSKIANYISNEYKIAFWLNGDKRFKQFAEEHVNKMFTQSFVESMQMYLATKLFEEISSNINVDSLSNINSELFDAIKRCNYYDKHADHTLYEDLYQYCKNNNSYEFEYIDVQRIHDNMNLSFKKKIDFLYNQYNNKLIDFVDDYTTYSLYINLMLLMWIVKLYKTSDSKMAIFKF